MSLTASECEALRLYQRQLAAELSEKARTNAAATLETLIAGANPTATMDDFLDTIPSILRLSVTLTHAAAAKAS